MAYSSDISVKTFIVAFVICIFIGIITKQYWLGFMSNPISFFVMFLRDTVGDNQIK